MPGYCPCGRPLVQKPKESNTAFKNRRYCNKEHMGLYFKPPNKNKNFGMERTKPTSPLRTGPGLLHYLYGKPIPQSAK